MRRGLPPASRLPLVCSKVLKALSTAPVKLPVRVSFVEVML